MVETEMDEEEFQFFAGMPPELVAKVVERLDLSARLSFRKTCRKCRGCADESRFFIESLKVMQIGDPGFNIRSNDRFEVYWSKRGEESKVKVGDQVQDVTGKDIIRMFQKTLSLILFSNRKLVIGQLTLNDLDSGSETALDLHNPVLHGFLKVEKLEAKFTSKENILKWLSICDQKTMQELALVWFPINQQGSPEVHVNDIKYDCEQLFQPENWKEFKEKWNDYNCFWMRRLAFSCVITADVDFAEEMSPSAEQILELKDALLKNTKLVKIELFGIRHSDFEAISALIETYNLETERNPTFVYYEYPESNMKLGMCVTERVIVFRGPCWVEAEDVNNFVMEEDEDEEDTDEEEEEAPAVPVAQAAILNQVPHPLLGVALAGVFHIARRAQAAPRALHPVQAGLRALAAVGALHPALVFAAQAAELQYVARQLVGDNADAAPGHAVPQNIPNAPLAPVANLVEQVNVYPMANQVPGALQAVVEAVAAPAVQAASARYQINGLVDGINGPQSTVVLTDVFTGQVHVLGLQEALDLFGVRLNGAVAMAVQDGERNFNEVTRQLLGENAAAAPDHAVPRNIQDAPVANVVEQVNVGQVADQVPGALQAVVEAVAAPAVQAASVRYHINGLVDGINGPQSMVILTDTMTGQVQFLGLQEALDLFGVRLNVPQ